MIRELWDLIDGFDERPDDWGKPYFSQQKYYKPKTIEIDNFQEFDFKEKDRVLCCVDGGNNKIFETPSESIHLLRIYFNLFRGKKRVENIEPLSLYLSCDHQEDEITVRSMKVNDSIPIGSDEYVVKKEELENGRPVNAGHTVRKYLEWETIKYVSENYLEEGDIILRDGVLQTGVEGEREYAEEAYNSVEENGVHLVGLAKTCTLRTTCGFPLVAAIQELSTEVSEGPWYYHPIAENEHPDHKGEMMVVKYHRNSNYAFRTEFYREIDNPVEEILEYMAFQAQDPIFLGYPYGLVDADKRARVTDEEIEYLKSVGFNRMGRTFKNKVSTLDAHDKLSEL